MAGLGPTPDNYADRYVSAMASASSTYEDVIGAVDHVLKGAFMTQLGGMCLAIEAPVEGGWVWITDRDDNLPWDRAHHSGWNVGLYLGNPEDEVEASCYQTTDDSSVGGLLEILASVLSLHSSCKTTTLAVGVEAMRSFGASEPWRTVAAVTKVGEVEWQVRFTDGTVVSTTKGARWDTRTRVRR